jgi:5-methylcytosine-specific restriction endonuclease McrA
MRRGDRWLELAERECWDAARVVAVCHFLNMKRDAAWIAEALGVTQSWVSTVAQQAKPLLRQTKRGQVQAELRCHYCGSTSDLTRDHIVPRSRGGSLEPDNIVYACRSCNSAKGDRTPEEWLR